MASFHTVIQAPALPPSCGPAIRYGLKVSCTEQQKGRENMEKTHPLTQIPLPEQHTSLLLTFHTQELTIWPLLDTRKAGRCNPYSWQQCHTVGREASILGKQLATNMYACAYIIIFLFAYFPRSDMNSMTARICFAHCRIPS